jgi:hypothetical protein
MTPALQGTQVPFAAKTRSRNPPNKHAPLQAPDARPDAPDIVGYVRVTSILKVCYCW